MFKAQFPSGKIFVAALIIAALSLLTWALAGKGTSEDSISGNTMADSGQAASAGGDSPEVDGQEIAFLEETFEAHAENETPAQAPAQAQQSQAQQSQTQAQQSQAQQPQTQSQAQAQPKAQPQVQQRAPEAPARGANVPSFNRYVLNIINTYQGRNYPYLLNNDYRNYNGVTTNLAYKGRVLARAHPSGNRASHCVGITFEVFFKAMQQRNKDLGLCPNDFNGLTWGELYDFMLTWYVANGPKSSSNLVRAVEKYGLGWGITRLEDARPGDFIDISRENNTGHAVVFINWLRDGNGRIIGINYWSSQPSTRGIGYNKEYFNVRDARGNKYGNVRTDNIYIARVQP